MWDFRPCPLDSVPFRWRDKAFFIEASTRRCQSCGQTSQIVVYHRHALGRMRGSKSFMEIMFLGERNVSEASSALCEAWQSGVCGICRV